MQSESNQNKKKSIFRDFLEYLFILVPPALVVLYINHSHCWPYSAMRQYYSTTRFKDSPSAHNNMLFTFVFIAMVGIFLLLKYTYKKLIK
jgi:hypothetical protein